MTARQDFNFDEWAALAKDDPVEFERRRSALLTSAIDAMPEHMSPMKDSLRANLLGKERSDKPALDQAVEAFNLMQTSVHQLTDAYGALGRCLPEDSVEAKVALTAADRFTRLTVE